MSGIFIVEAPFLIAASTVLHMKSKLVRVPSSQDHSTSSHKFLANETLSITFWYTWSGSSCNLCFMCNSLVEINVWILGWAAFLRASAADWISFWDALLKAHTCDFFIIEEISFTALKSPFDAAGKPASIISTPRVSKALAILIFSSMFIDAPGDCSPSLIVVSKIFILFVSCVISNNSSYYLLNVLKLSIPCSWNYFAQGLLSRFNSNKIWDKGALIVSEYFEILVFLTNFFIVRSITLIMLCLYLFLI